MKISYAITVCNEHKEIQKLLTFLFEHKRKEDQVVVQMDFDNATTEVVQACERWESKPSEEYKLIQHKYLIEALPFILEANADTEAYWLPRVNTVAGITDEHIAKWGWRVDGEGWVNFPDWQMRLYRNDDNIYWIKPVHEQLKGYTKFANLPAEENYCLYHPKDIGRQESQNAFYETI